MIDSIKDFHKIKVGYFVLTVYDAGYDPEIMEIDRIDPLGARLYDDKCSDALHNIFGCPRSKDYVFETKEEMRLFFPEHFI
jgi:hypothetical protein